MTREKLYDKAHQRVHPPIPSQLREIYAVDPATQQVNLLAFISKPHLEFTLPNFLKNNCTDEALLDQGRNSYSKQQFTFLFPQLSQSHLYEAYRCRYRHRLHVFLLPDDVSETSRKVSAKKLTPPFLTNSNESSLYINFGATN